MTSSPIVARWELSRRLGTRRRELDMSVQVITEALGFTRNYWSAVENDRTLIAEDKLRQLFDVLQFEEPDRSELLELREASRERGWWDDYADVLPRDVARFYGLEYGATEIKVYESNLIPGILQTEDYARAIIRADPSVSQMGLDDMVALRLLRQEQLLQKESLQLTVLLGEAALRQQLDGVDVHRRQLEHLLELGQRLGDALRIQVLPFSTSPGLIAGSSTLLFFRFDSPHLPRVACQEAVPTLNYIESNDADFRSLEHSWDEGFTRSLRTSESIDLVKAIANLS